METQDGGTLSSVPAKWLKAAALLEMLGAQAAAELLKRCSQTEVGRLAAAFRELNGVEAPRRAKLAQEAMSELRAGRVAPGDLLGFAQQVLSAALGTELADGLLRGEVADGPTPSLERLPEATVEPLAQLLQQESPRVSALILALLRPAVAARVLALLPAEVRGASILHLALGNRPGVEVLQCIARAVTGHVERTGSLPLLDCAEVAARVTVGPAKVVEVMRQCDNTTERATLDYLEQQAPDLAAQVSQSIFSTIADLKWLDVRSLQTVLRQIETRELAKALRGASDEVRRFCFENLSENAAAAVREEIETMGPIPKREVESAQRMVLGTIRTMLEQGRIQVAQEEEMI